MPLKGVLPTTETIIGGRYSVARSLYVYVKGKNISLTKGLSEFAQFIVSDAAIGDEGFLIVKGLIPLSPPTRKTMQSKAKSL